MVRCRYIVRSIILVAAFCTIGYYSGYVLKILRPQPIPARCDDPNMKFTEAPDMKFTAAPGMKFTAAPIPPHVWQHVRRLKDKHPYPTCSRPQNNIIYIKTVTRQEALHSHVYLKGIQLETI